MDLDNMSVADGTDIAGETIFDYSWSFQQPATRTKRETFDKDKKVTWCPVLGQLDDQDNMKGTGHLSLLAPFGLQRASEQ